jgi:phosphoribosylaminoimidazole-succinocarboxamide synthase
MPQGLEAEARLDGNPAASPRELAERAESPRELPEHAASARQLAERARDASLAVYRHAADHARERGIILADTKFELGLDADGVLTLGDEVCTPDSSRFWPADRYEPGRSQPSFDKQYVRDWASDTGWDRTPPAPPIPDDIVTRTREKYVEAYERITGEPFDAWVRRTEAGPATGRPAGARPAPAGPTP